MPFLYAAIWLALAIPGHRAVPTLVLTGLRTEYLTNPIGTAGTPPRLSWRLESAERDVAQTGYEIAVSTDSTDLRAGRKLLWTSGRVDSSASLYQPYRGPALTARTRYYWHVRVWDSHGTVTPWSSTAFWETGLLAPTDWHAEWIGPPAALHDTAGAPAPMLRRAFRVDRRVVSARVYVTSRGLYELHLNGHRVGDAYFAPGWTSFRNRLQYQTYDVTSLLVPGANAIGVILGDGWYRGYLGFSGRKNDYGTDIAALVQLEIRYADGRSMMVTSDSAWKGATGPIRFADIYRGETYDARLERAGWDGGGYNDQGWLPVARAASTSAALVPPVSEPVRRTQTVTPIAILHSPAGETIVDLGQNITGWVRLRVSGPAGTTVTLRHGEVLDKNGNLYTDNLRAAAQTDRYTLRGGGEEVYEPHFTYHGFRYVAVDGFPGTVTFSTVTGIVVHSDLEETGTFVTSDSMINKLQRNILWGQRGNFLDVPTDCPQRDERLGWTGDAQVFARTAAFNMRVDGFFAKWLADLAADQYPGGAVPWVIPNPLGGDSAQYASTPGWSDASTVVPWTMYLMYGDRGTLERQYESMHKWVDYGARQAGPGLVWHTDGFGDWLALHSDDASYPGATTGKDFIATVYLAHSADIVARAAAVLGRSADAAHYRALFDAIRTAFRREFVSPNGRVSENTQTAYALALDFGLLEPGEVAGAAQRLAQDVAEHDGHLTTGFLGTPELTTALSQNGYLTTAFSLLMQRSYPSWLYPITRGATTMWERWDGIRPDGSFEETSMNSFNHYAFGAIGDWMYRTIGGIDIDPAAPGYRHTIITPHVGGGLTSARTTLETGYGLLVTDWHVNGATFTLDVTVPPNTTASVTLPGAVIDRVTEGGAPVRGVAGVRRVTQRGVDVEIEVGSGSYVFRAGR
ncbi:MAG TPA: family 78 glycoside hydrolase catalytic domain [Gemmatimonadales bacterium]|jgi:alpha-L-rhamnosidase